VPPVSKGKTNKPVSNKTKRKGQEPANKYTFKAIELHVRLP
jgi:hypothetical protein